MQKAAAADRCAKTLTEKKAAEIMWLYYRDNKALMQSTVGEYREGILAELMQGFAAENVFSKFALDAPPLPTRKPKCKVHRAR